jgi:hypothetical protein
MRWRGRRAGWSRRAFAVGGRGGRLVALAAASSPEDFEKTLTRETARWDDGEARLAATAAVHGVEALGGQGERDDRLSGAFDRSGAAF